MEENLKEMLIPLFDSAPYLVSLAAGFLTFLSPCVLPLIPAYLSYISGLSLKKLQGKEEVTFADKLHIMQASLMFIFGFSVIFVLLGVVVESTIGDMLQSSTASVIAGGIIIIFGLHTMHVINIGFLNFEARAQFGDVHTGGTSFKQKFMHFFAPFVLGLSFALGWSPCVGPILGTILTYAGQDDTAAVTLMSVYALGLGIPFFLSAVLTSSALHVLNRLKRSFRTIEIVSGILLIIVGISIAIGSLSELTGYVDQMLGVE